MRKLIAFIYGGVWGTIAVLLSGGSLPTLVGLSILACGIALFTSGIVVDTIVEFIDEIT